MFGWAASTPYQTRLSIFMGVNFVVNFQNKIREIGENWRSMGSVFRPKFFSLQPVNVVRGSPCQGVLWI